MAQEAIQLGVTAPAAGFRVDDVDPGYPLRIIPGALVGAGAGMGTGMIAVIALGCFEECYGEEGFVVAAAVVGHVLGSALGASYAVGRERCEDGQRFARALRGASLGMLAGLGLMLVPVKPVQSSIVLTIPIGAALYVREC